jgi:CBS domain containing-hemolysin-like protein
MGVSEDELRFLADEAASSGEIDLSDHELIERGFELGDLDVGEIIVPRLDVVAVAVETPVSEALDIAVAAGHRRLPVHEGDLDSVVGVVGLRDLAAAVSEGSVAVAGDLAKSVPIVPETKRVMELLREMQVRGRHLAVVIDEHGGTSGIVTIEDVVEELVGQVADEGEVRRPSFKRLAPGKWEVDTRTDVADIEDLIGRDLPQGDWHTVAGLVIHLAGRIPVAGDVVEIEDHTILVTEATARRVQRVVIERTIPPGPTTTAGETA